MRKPERNRKQRKARYIQLRNLMLKYPECAYGGDFYCNQMLGYYGPSLGADFSFYHTQKKRYYACCLQTCDVAAYIAVEDKFLDVKDSDARHDIIMKNLPSLWTPSIEIKDYGPVAIGLWATVNKEYVDEHVIREFIADFRSLGEPTKPGWYWEGKAVPVDPGKLEKQSTPA